MKRAAVPASLALCVHAAVGAAVIAAGSRVRATPPAPRRQRIEIELAVPTALPRIPGAAAPAAQASAEAAQRRKRAAEAAPVPPRGEADRRRSEIARSRPPRAPLAARRRTPQPPLAAAPSPAAQTTAAAGSAAAAPAALAPITAPVGTGTTGDALHALAAAATAPPPAATAAARRALLARYATTVRADVKRRQRYPRRARSLGLEGRVVIELEIRPSGRLAAPPRIGRRSGFPLLDREAVRMARAAAPFPPPPGGAAVTLAIPIEFSLR